MQPEVRPSHHELLQLAPHPNPRQHGSLHEETTVESTSTAWGHSSSTKPAIVSRVLGSMTSPTNHLLRPSATLQRPQARQPINTCHQDEAGGAGVIHSCTCPCFGGKAEVEVEVEVQHQAGSRDCHAMCLTCATTREQSTAPSAEFVAVILAGVAEIEHVESGVVVDGWRAWYGGV
jgi:hypothetical protein